jgi:Na+-transporting NADH:ubiquinone oxidoreductase subunit A
LRCFLKRLISVRGITLQISKNTVMKQRTIKYLFSTISAGLISSSLLAQGASGGNSNILLYSLLAVVVLFILGLLIQVSDNLLGIKAKQIGLDQEEHNFSVFPRLNEIFAVPKPNYLGSAPYVSLKKGFDILLEGAAERKKLSAQARTFAVQPPNFKGISPIPKMEVEVGSEVQAGDVLFYAKAQPNIKFVTPVSGEIIAINRGPKRAITEVVILADKTQRYRVLAPPSLDTCTREELRSFLMESGGWSLLRQRPFNVIPGEEDAPRDIFISTFDTAPLAPDANYIVADKAAEFQRGLDVLARLTDGDVWLGLDARGKNAPAEAFTKASGVKMCWFSGQHPAGNVGVQIHHIRPIRSGEQVWTLGVQEVITIGALFTQQRFQAARVVALTGNEFAQTGYVDTFIGANIGDLLAGNLKNDHIRVISGDVLSGAAKTNAEFLDVFDDQITVLEEGDDYEMFGWLAPSYRRPTVSRTYLSNLLFPSEPFQANTNTHGEQRAFVVTGQYEDVLPMDVLPQHLFKSILAGDIERMEGLGIYELVEEDVALCEFACTSKQHLQSILRDGMEIIQEQI